MDEKMREILRSLPSVDSILTTPCMAELIDKYGRTCAGDAVRTVIERTRKEIREDKGVDVTSCDADGIAEKTAALLAESDRSALKKVVNATGIILHTGLGRAVMPPEAAAALADRTGCSNLQIDLDSGERNEREDLIRDLVRDLTGAEDVALVNNNAGATFLILRALAEGKEVVISRGELIEIGGSFRLPDIMKESGVILREVGTTNKTHARDYEKAVGPSTGLLMKAHKSNYKIVGFTQEVGIAEIAAIGKRHGITVVDDLGCGAMVPMEQFGLEHETTVRESLQAGADIACFSTDKLIGGPQGGLIVGRKDLIRRIRSHPAYRMLRVCKLTIAALEATLRLFRSPDLLARRHPVYRMLAKKPEDIRSQAESLAESIRSRRPKWKVSVVEEVSFLGGGALPDSEIPSFAVRLAPADMSAGEAARLLREAETPVIARVKDDAVLLDMRTVFPEEIGVIADVVGRLSAAEKKPAAAASK